MQGKGKAWEAGAGDDLNLRDELAGAGDDVDLRDGLADAGDRRDMSEKPAGAEDNAGMLEKQGKGIEMREEAKEKGAKDQAALERELKARLEWYATHVSDEAYDAKAVEYILYLLDSVAPLEEGAVPPKEEAWERFLTIADSQEEMLPLERDVDGLRPAAGDAGELAGAGNGKGGKMLKFRRFVARHKVIAAAVFMAVILAVGGSIQAGARRGEGFFFWLKEDETGIQMITSPENLDGKINQSEYVFYDKSDMPIWAQEWSEVEAGVVMLEGYEWECFETSELENFQSILSRYRCKNANKDIVLGLVVYFDKVTINKDVYEDYNFVMDYETDSGLAKIYNKIDESKKTYYAICFYKDNFKYFVEGEEDLDKIKKLMEKYLDCVKIEK